MRWSVDKLDSQTRGAVVEVSVLGHGYLSIYYYTYVVIYHYRINIAITPIMTQHTSLIDHYC